MRKSHLGRSVSDSVSRFPPPAMPASRSGRRNRARSFLSAMSVALVSNLTFPINGRDYGSEDRLLAEQLRSRGLEVQLVLPETLLPLSAPLNAGQLESQAKLLMNVEAIFCRNNYGGLLEKEYRAALDAFTAATNRGGRCLMT